MSLDRHLAQDFITDYGRHWQAWKIEASVGLFSDDVLYVAHPDEVVVGSEDLGRYLEKEQAEQGEVLVRMGRPLVDADQVMAEFWVTATAEGEEASIAGCLIARLDDSGCCTHFREYWFDLEGHRQPFDGWGT
jgi:hypothetical protein